MPDGRKLMPQVAEDLSYVVMLRRKFGYLENIPGVLLQHPSTASVFPGGGGGCVGYGCICGGLHFSLINMIVCV